MINIKKLTENMNKMYPKSNPIMEYTFSELRNASDDARKARARFGSGLVVNYQSGTLDQSKDGHVRTHWIVENKNKGTAYSQVVQIRVPVAGGLFSFASSKKRNLKEVSDALAKAEIRVHCSCPDFYWSGMKYNLGPNGPMKGALAHDIHAGLPREQRNPEYPDERDPEGKHVLCKHLIALMSVLPTNASSIMKDVRLYAKNSTMIQTNDQLTNNMDKGSAALDKDVNRSQPDEEETIAVTEGDKNAMAVAFAEDIVNNKSEGSSEIIDTKNEEIKEPDVTTILPKEEIEEIASSSIDQSDESTEDVVDPDGVADIITDENDVSDEDSSGETDINDILNKPTSEDHVNEVDDKKTEHNVNDILSRT